MSNLLGICLLGALLEMDTTYAFQLTFSRGIIAGPLLGLLTGEVMTGLQVGVFTELLFVDISPLGGLLPPSAAVCCTVSMALCSLGIPVYFSFFFGAISAILFAVAEVLVRKHRIGWIRFEEEKIMQHPAHLNWTVLQSLAMSFVCTFAFVFCVSAGVGSCFSKLLAYLPEQLHMASKFAYMAVPWIGLATLISLFRFKTR